MRQIKNQKGVALMIAIAALMLIMYMAMEITYDSSIEYTVNSQNLNRIKAYYAAKSGMEIALLRVKIYQQVRDQFGSQMGSNASMLDEIWRFPFAWPLQPLPGMNPVDADSLKEMVGNSTMDATYFTTIEDEGSKIDLNDLISPSKVLREAAQQQLMRIFEQKILEDRDFERRLENQRPEQIITNIADYISSSMTSVSGGGAKSGNYSELNRLAGKDLFPPNRGFRTLDELRFVPGITEEVYQLLLPRITIFGMKGINPNLATKEVLKSLDTGFTDELVTELIKRRDDLNLGGPYQNADDFWNYVRQMRGQINGDPTQVPLIFESITNFRIRSTGEFAGAAREITAIVMDVDRVAQKVADQLIAEKAEAEGKEPPKKEKSQSSRKTQTKGPPRIVSWDER